MALHMPGLCDIALNIVISLSQNVTCTIDEYDVPNDIYIKSKMTGLSAIPVEQPDILVILKSLD